MSTMNRGDDELCAGLIGHAMGRQQGRNEGYGDGIADGENRGYRMGRARGYQEGKVAGLAEGRSIGYDEGWSEAVERANTEIAKANDMLATQQCERDELWKAVQEQQKLIAELDAKVQQLTEREAILAAENAELRRANQSLVDTVTALKDANARLVDDVRALDSKMRTKEQENAQLFLNHNQALVFIGAVRDALDELATGSTPEAIQARKLFADKYQRRVTDALEEGSILKPLDEDAEFMRALPATHRFIRRMLDAAEMDNVASVASSEEATAFDI